MNNRIQELIKQATTITYEDDGWRLYGTKVETFNKEKFAELMVKEHLDLLRQEWYNLNNLPSSANESPRDIGLRVGKKSEIIVLIEKIKKHFGVEE